MPEKDGMADQVEGRRAVQQGKEDWFVAIESYKGVIKNRYDGSLS